MPRRLKPLDSASPVPLHLQAERRLRALVAQPDFQAGALLPDEVTLARQLGVSRGTLRLAFAALVHEGLLDRRAGVGTRVGKPQAESAIQAWRSLTREMAAKGVTVRNFRLEYRLVTAPAGAARALQLADGAHVWRLDRLRGWNDTPVLHSTSWFHPRLGLSGAEDFQQPLYEVLEQATGAVPRRAREEFRAVPARGRMARSLRVAPGSPLLLRRHTVYDAADRPFEHAEVRYVSARFALTLELHRGEP